MLALHLIMLGENSAHCGSETVPSTLSKAGFTGPQAHSELCSNETFMSR